MYCIYHSRDLDGFASGAIVKRKYPDAILIGYDYGEPIPEIPAGEPIIMIDVSLPMEEMYKLAEHSGFQLTWIDHHISAIESYYNYVTALNKEDSHFLTPVLENGIAACEIGWAYLFPEETIPTAIQLLGEYDTWRKSSEDHWNNVILPFQFGMRQICNSPESFDSTIFKRMWQGVEYIQSIIHSGKTILDYQSKVSETLCRRGAFEIDFMGYRAICLNAGGFNSDTFKSVYDESKHDLMMPFMFNGKKWIFSLYTTHDHIDCSMIAKQNGGGGHKKAAGFESEEFIFFKSKIAN